LNDFQSTAFGILEARKKDFVLINNIQRQKGKTTYVLGMGTGIGFA